MTISHYLKKKREKIHNIGVVQQKGDKNPLSLSLSLVAMTHGDDPQNFLVALSHGDDSQKLIVAVLKEK